MKMKRIAVLTSGGDAPGMNAALRAVVRCGAYYGMETWGVEQGYDGLIDGLFHKLEIRDVGAIIHRGGTMLRTARSSRFMTDQGRAEALAQCRQRDVEGLVVIGGDGSFRGAWELHKLGLPVVGVPGTIDNDVNGTDMTIGFDTALNTALDALRRLRDTAHSHDRLFIVEVMGRGSGYLALRTAVAGGAEVTVIPEIPFDMDAVCQKLKNSQEQGKKFSIIVVAEGAMSGYELKERLQARGYDATVTVLGHIQRGGAPSSFDATLASRMGAYAVECLHEGRKGVMAAIVNGFMQPVPLPEAWSRKKAPNAELMSLVEKLSI